METTFKNLKNFETISIGNNTSVMRIPGGHLYTVFVETNNYDENRPSISVSTTFVPLFVPLF